MGSAADLGDYQCQHCGELIEEGHNCNGAPFRSTAPRPSVAAEGPRRELLRAKGFHEASNLDGVFYYHPMYGVVAIYPGGAFKTACVKTQFALDDYLGSLDDSNYTEIRELEELRGVRCDSCGQVGAILPDKYSPFSHEITCKQTRYR
jgi:hypothetical protein